MTRTRALCVGTLILTMAACGGRSSPMHAQYFADGGGTSEAGASVKHDGGLAIDGQGSRSSDALADAGVDDGRSNALPDGGLGDGRPGISDDARTGDGATDVPISGADGSPDGLGTSDARPGDARDGTTINPDGVSTPDAAATLTSLDISPSGTITVNVGTTRTLTITAIYSDGNKVDVSSAASVTSADTSILTVSGATLTGHGTTVASTTITVTYKGVSQTASVTVNGSNPLVSISIDNVPTTSMAVGATVTLVAYGVYTDGTKLDITADATWASTNTSACTVGDTTTTKAIVTGVASGSCYVTATVGSIVGKSSQISVSSKTLTSISISPATTTLQRGLTNQQFSATGYYDDGSFGDVTLGATWASDNTAAVTVVATGSNAGKVSTVGTGEANVTATVGSIVGTAGVTVTAAPLRSIKITGSSVLIAGNGKAYTATGSYADGETADLTSSVTWSSDNTAVLTVSNAAATAGVATGVAAGTANLKATLGNVSGQLGVTVSDAALISITLNPTSVSNLIVGLTSAIKATGLYGDAADTSTQFSMDITSAVTWTTSNSAYATVSNVSATAGQVTGVAAGGPVTITATLSGKSATASVTVISATLTAIAITPATASIRAGKTYPFTAKGSYDDGSTVDITSAVTWTSSNTATATISNVAGANGVATGVAASSTAVTITATLSSKSATASLTVTEATIVSIQIQPSTTQTIAAGSTVSYTVVAVYENGTTATLQSGVTWTSSNTAVATIATSTGGGGPGGGGGFAQGGATATGVATGTTTITASYTSSAGTTFTDSQSLVVTAEKTVSAIRFNVSSATIKVGETQDYTVYVDYSDGSSTTVSNGVTLTSDNGTVASVSSGGGGGGIGAGGGNLSATGLAVGKATITASYTANSATFTATTTLNVTVASTLSGLYLTPTSATVLVGATQQLRAYATYSDGTYTDVTASSNLAWTLDDGTVASITTGSTGGGRGAVFAQGGGGLATGLGAGSTTITASYTPSDGSTAKTATASLTVNKKTVQSLTISPTTVSMLVDGTQSFVAQLNYTDGSYTTVTSSATWTTTDASVVVLGTSAGGPTGGAGGAGVVGGATATAVGTGSAKLTVSYTDSASTYTATASVTVTDPAVLSLQISPTLPILYLSGSTTQQFRATVIYNDANNTTKDVTSSAQWTSSDATVAVVSSSGQTAGRATALKTGSTVIQASYTDATNKTFTAKTTLTVQDRALTAIEISPSSATTHLGFTQGFSATGIYDNGNSSADITSSVTWTSSSTGVATIAAPGTGPAGGAKAVATPVAAGTTFITASYGSISSAQVTLTVSSGTLSSVTVAASSGATSVAVGSTLQLYATGNFSDSTTQDLTSSATWLSSNDGYATVSTVSGSKGLVTGVSAGAPTIRANYNGTVGTLAITVQ